MKSHFLPKRSTRSNGALRSPALLITLGLVAILTTAVPSVRQAFSQGGDGDADGMPDTWESTYGLDTSVDDSQADGDGDGVSNIDEYGAGTDPTQWDSDGNGSSDYLAVYGSASYVAQPEIGNFSYKLIYPDGSANEWFFAPSEWIYEGFTRGDGELGDWGYVEYDSTTGAPSYYYSWDWYPDGVGDTSAYTYFDGSAEGSHSETLPDGRIADWSWGNDYFNREFRADDWSSSEGFYTQRDQTSGIHNLTIWEYAADGSGENKYLNFFPDGNISSENISKYFADGSAEYNDTVYAPDGNPYYDYTSSWYPDGSGDPGTYYYYDIDGDGFTDYDEETVYFTDKYTVNVFDPENPQAFNGQSEGTFSRTNADGSTEDWWWGTDYVSYNRSNPDGSGLSSYTYYLDDGTWYFDESTFFADGSNETSSTYYAADGSPYYVYTSSWYPDGSGDPGTYVYHDSDGDGLNDYDEDTLTFTDKYNPDTDGDGISDYWEYQNTLDPNSDDSTGDEDTDQLSNLAEFLFNLNPRNSDSDGDGVGDYDAVYNAEADSVYATQDTDGDGIPDRDELRLGLNPLNPTDAALDPDGDGRSNLQEFHDGTDPHTEDHVPNDQIGEGVFYSRQLWGVAEGGGGETMFFWAEGTVDQNYHYEDGTIPAGSSFATFTATLDQSFASVFHSPETGWEVLASGIGPNHSAAAYDLGDVGDVVVESYSAVTTQMKVRLDAPAREGGETVVKRFLMRVDNDAGVVQEKTSLKRIVFTVPAGELDSEIVTLPAFDLELGESGTFEEFDLSLDMVEVDDEGEETGLVNVIKPSMPTPSVSMASPSYSGLSEGADGQILMDFSFDATITSKALDTIAGDRGKIGPENVFMLLNGVEVGTEQTSLSLTETKGSLAIKAPGRYPYQGDLSVVATQVEVTEGVNLVEIRVVNPIYGTVGVGGFSFKVKVDQAEDGGGDIGISWSAMLGEISDESVTPEAEGTANIVFTVDGIDTAIELEETAADSNVFVTAGGEVTATFVTDESGGSTVTLDAPDYGLTGATFEAQNQDGSWYFGGDAWYSFPEEAASCGGCDEGEPEPEKRFTVYDTLLRYSVSGEDPNLHNFVMKFGDFASLEEAGITQNELQGMLISLGANGYVPSEEEDVVALIEGLQVKKMYGSHYIEDPDNPGQPLIFQVKLMDNGTVPENWVGRTESQDSEFSAGDAVKFGAGFVVGVGSGGYDLVAGTGKVLWGGVKYAARGAQLWYAVIRISWNTWIQGDYEEADELIAKYEPVANEQQAVMDEVAGIARLMGAVAAGIIEYGDDYLISLLADPETAEAAGIRVDSTNHQIAKVAGMLLLEIKDQWEGATPYEKGKIAGRVFFEVGSIFVGPGAIAQLAKRGTVVKTSDVLDELVTSGKLADGLPEYKAGLEGATATKAAALAATRMCFVAGTLVAARIDGQEISVPIEQLERLARSGRAVEVWSRDEVSKQEGWKRVLDYFTTHPDELFHVGIDVDGDGIQEEVITATGEHPFYVESREEPGFYPVRELLMGDELSLTNGKPAWISRIGQERAPPGEAFTTYNFEVADYHTYFVGELGFWVHNAGGEFCERLSILFNPFVTKANGNPWDAQRLAMQKLDVLVGADPRLGKNSVARVQILTEARRRHFTDIPGTNRPWLNGGQTLALTNPPANTGQMAKELAANMEKIYLVGKPKGFSAHHLVPPGYNDAAGNANRLRQLLDQHGIHLNEAGNGLYIPHFRKTAEAYPSLGPIHGTLHTDAMMAKLWARLDGVPDPDKTKLLDELQKIAYDIVEGNLTPN